MKNAVIGAVLTAAVSTLGDYLWANVLPHGQPVYWFAHAIVLFLTIGACLGLPSRRPIVGYAGSMFMLFALLWIALGMLTGRVPPRRDNYPPALGRSAPFTAPSG